MTKQQLIQKLTDIEWDYFFILFERVTMRIDKPFKLDNTGFAKEDYPYIDALREALVNMLMHADYFSPIKSRVRIFNDKIEFFNAGAYPKPVEYFLQNDTSMPRNPILAKLFRAIKLAENAGYGFDKMIEGWKTYTSIPILFQTELDTSTTVFDLHVKTDQVLVDGYEDGLDAVLSSKIVDVEYDESKAWYYGPFEEVEKSETTAVRLISTRGSRY